MNTEKIYKMTFRRHLNYIWMSMMFFLIAPGIYLYSLVKGQDGASLIVFLIIWIILGLLYLTGFILHFNYYRIDKNKKVCVDKFSNITIHDTTGIYSFSENDIDSITNHHSGLNNLTPWNGYEFSVFKLKDGKELIITCLLMDLDTIIDLFSCDIVMKKNHFYASLNKV